MTKRSCETCRFFQAAEFDKMGWCGHPSRQSGDDVRIFIRAASLACRDGWSSDLWQAKGADGGLRLLPTPGPESPATFAEVTFLASRSPQPAPASFQEDVVVGEFTAAPAQLRPKDVLRRAHEELRALKRERRSFVNPIPDPESDLAGDSSEPPPVAFQPTTERSEAARKGDDMPLPNRPLKRPIIGDVPPVTVDEMSRQYPKMTTFSDDDERFSSVPEAVPGFELPLISKPAPVEKVIRRAGFDDDFELTAWATDPIEPVASTPIESVTRPVHASSAPSADELVDPLGSRRPRQASADSVREASHRATDELPVRRERGPEHRDSVSMDAEFGQWESQAIQRTARRPKREPLLPQFADVADVTERVGAERVTWAPEPEPVLETPMVADTTPVGPIDVVSPHVLEADRIDDPNSMRPERRGRDVAAESRDFDMPAAHSPLQWSEPEPNLAGPRAAIAAPLSPETRQRPRLDRQPRESEQRLPVSRDPYAEQMLARTEREVWDAPARPRAERTATPQREDLTRGPYRETAHYDELGYPIAGDRIDERFTALANAAELDLISGSVGAPAERWAGVNRACRTCRDFRPAENGERGWCTNKWAFSHRRMVDADELPCETSIGGWWLPSDELWLSAVDVSAHGLPTPLLDKWIKDRLAASGEMQDTQPLRRRKRS